MRIHHIDHIRIFMDGLVESSHSRCLIDIWQRHPVYPSWGTLPGYQYFYAGQKYVIYFLKQKSEIEITIIKDTDVGVRSIFFGPKGGFCEKWKQSFLMFAESYYDSTVYNRDGVVYLCNEIWGERRAHKLFPYWIPSSKQKLLQNGKEVFMNNRELASIAITLSFAYSHTTPQKIYVT